MHGSVQHAPVVRGGRLRSRAAHRTNPIEALPCRRYITRAMELAVQTSGRCARVLQQALELHVWITQKARAHVREAVMSAAIVNQLHHFVADRTRAVAPSRAAQTDAVIDDTRSISRLIRLSWIDQRRDTRSDAFLR